MQEDRDCARGAPAPRHRARLVHAWRPRGYRHRAAGTVVYLHGYYTDVDQAWVDHRLAEQFRQQRPQRALPRGRGPVLERRGALLADARRAPRHRGAAREGEASRAARVVVAGHSGAFRGIVPWLADPRIREVLLLDGLYQAERSWSDWLDGAPRGRRRLVLVGLETAARSEAWLPTRPGAVFLPRVPEPRRGLHEVASASAPVLYMRSQHDHMAIIEKGEVLPLLLRTASCAHTRR